MSKISRATLNYLFRLFLSERSSLNLQCCNLQACLLFIQILQHIITQNQYVGNIFISYQCLLEVSTVINYYGI